MRSIGTWGGVARMLLAMGLLGVLPAAGAQTVEYFHTDALGTPVAVSNASGSVIERSEYAPYGELLNRPATDGPGFTGHVQDTATGMTYMQQRYYDSGIGRFLSVDPVTANSGTGANFNRYWYANNNPYKFSDPDGRMIQDRWRDPFGEVRLHRGPFRTPCGQPVCLSAGDGGGDTPRTDEYVSGNGNSGEKGSLGAALLGDVFEKLSDGEAWKDSAVEVGKDTSEAVGSTFKLFGDLGKCATRCAFQEFVGDSPGEVAKNIAQETTLSAMERGFDEADMPRSSKAVNKVGKGMNWLGVAQTYVCTVRQQCSSGDE